MIHTSRDSLIFFSPLNIVSFLDVSLFMSLLYLINLIYTLLFIGPLKITVLGNDLLTHVQCPIKIKHVCL